LRHEVLIWCGGVQLEAALVLAVVVEAEAADKLLNFVGMGSDSADKALDLLIGVALRNWMDRMVPVSSLVTCNCQVDSLEVVALEEVVAENPCSGKFPGCSYFAAMECQSHLFGVMVGQS